MAALQADLRVAHDPHLAQAHIERRPKVNDQSNRSARLRYTAAGALATLAVVGAIAGTAALAAKPSAHPAHSARDALAAKRTAASASGQAVKTGAPEPKADPQPFLDDIQRLVDNGTITAAEAQVVDHEIEAGRVDTDSLTAAGFTPAQLLAVQQALTSTKRGLASAAHGGSK
jgi:hypothetical protein